MVLSNGPDVEVWALAVIVGKVSAETSTRLQGISSSFKCPLYSVPSSQFLLCREDMTELRL